MKKNFIKEEWKWRLIFIIFPMGSDTPLTSLTSFAGMARMAGGLASGGMNQPAATAGKIARKVGRRK